MTRATAENPIRVHGMVYVKKTYTIAKFKYDDSLDASTPWATLGIATAAAKRFIKTRRDHAELTITHTGYPCL